MPNPRDVIESIREELLVGVQLDARVEKGAAKLRQIINNSLRLLSDDLYASQMHFVLELIQNADDNSYEPSVTPRLTFEIGPAKVVVRNNERGFAEANVRALCSVGESTKTTKLGFIGEKGIGFKSVFTVSDSPEIHSNGFHFCFVGQRDEALGFVVPHWIDGAPENGQKGTTIVLPAKQNQKFEESLFEDIEDELLLFLRRLRVIEIVDRNRKATTTIEKDFEGEFIRVTRKPAGEGRRYFLVRHKVDVSGLEEEKRQGIVESEQVLAFRVDARGHAAPEKDHKVFAFLPVRHFGLRFILQSDFLLNASREDIHIQSSWNLHLRDQIAAAFVSAVPRFQKQKGLGATFYRYLPVKDEVTDPFFEPVVSQIYAALSDQDVILAQSGRWVRPEQALRRESACDKLFSNADLRELIDREYVSDLVPVDVDPEVFEELGCPQFSVAHVLECLANSNWVEKRPTRWFGTLLEYLSAHELSDSEREAISKLAIFPLTSGKLTSIESGPIFLPIAGAKKYGFEDQLRVLSSEVLPKERADNKRLLEWLQEMGLKSASPIDIIDHHVLPIHSSEEWKECPSEALVGHLAYVKEHLDSYLEKLTAKQQGWLRESKTKEFVEKLAGTLWVRILQTKKTEDELYHHASELYLGKDFGNSHPLEKLFAGDDEVSFISPAYLASGTGVRKDQDAAAVEWAAFFRQIGAHERPRVLARNGQGAGGLTPKKWPSTGRAGFQHEDWVPSPELQRAMAAANDDVRRILLKILDHDWTFYGKRCVAHVVGTWYNNRNAEDCDSSFIIALRELAVPTTNGRQAKLQDAYLNSQELRDIFGARVPYLATKISSQGLLDAAGVRCRADAETALRTLREWRGSGSGTLEAVKRMYRIIELHKGKDAEKLRETFSAEPLLFLRGNPNRWVSASEACWQSYGRVLRPFIASLEQDYSDFRGFLLEVVGLPKRLSCEQLVKVLQAVEQSDMPPEEKGQAARTLYFELNAGLEEQQQPSASENEEWIATLRKGLWWTSKDDFWSDDGDLYVNDRPDLAKLFADTPELAFIGVEPSDLPKMRALIAVAGLRLLSGSVEREFPEAGNRKSASGLTSRIRSRTRRIAQYVYCHRSARAFRELADSGVFAALSELTVCIVPTLEITVRLNQVEAKAQVPALVSDNVLFVDADSQDDFNCIAAELCKLLDIEPTAAACIALTLMQTDDVQVARLFSTYNIPELPEAEAARMSGLPKSEEPQKVETPAAAEAEAPATPEAEEGAEVAEPAGGTEEGSPRKPAQTPKAEDETKPSGEKATASAPTAPPPQGPKTESEAEIVSQRPSGRNESEPSPSRRDRVPVYVAPEGGEPDANDSASEDREWRVKLGAAAVEKVCSAEESNGWKTTCMPQTHEGYDIEANKDGQTRFIEVKGLKGEWTERGVGLSRAQYEYARNHQDSYWVYIVENALGPGEPRITRIQNPAKRITEYRLDSTWRQLAQSLPMARNAPAQWKGRTLRTDEGLQGTIQEVKARGQLLSLYVELPTETKWVTFNPATMTVE